MSYDLYLSPRPDKPPLDRGAFLAHFAGHHWKVEGDTASYHNEDTGVTFQVSYHAGGEPPDPDDPRDFVRRPHASFTINYFRPHTFGLEAQAELARLVKAFDFLVNDPQAEGMGDGEFTPEGFLRGWNAGNRAAARAMLSLGEEHRAAGTFALPAEANRQIWAWNYHRTAFGDELFDGGVDVFVPRIFFITRDGRLRTLCLWPNLLPSALPKVDLLLVARDKLPRDLHVEPLPAALVAWESVRQLAEAFEVVTDVTGDTLDYLLLDYGTAEDAPEELVAFVHGLPALGDKLPGVAPDSVLDAELLDPSPASPPHG